jgi:hypothetical protein
MIQGVNAVAVAATVLLGLVTVAYVRIASEPHQLGPNPIAVLYLTGAVLTCVGGTVVTAKRWRIGLLAATSAASLALGTVTFSIGIGLMLAAFVAGGAVLGEFSGATPADGAAALVGAAVGLAAFGLTWHIAVQGT